MNPEEKSRTRKPPGGECSDIFGEKPLVTKVPLKSNPSFTSSVFDNDCTSERVKSKNKTTADVQKLSNIPMFTSNQELQEQVIHKTRNRITESSVFANDEYPCNNKFEPGISQKPNTAFKLANDSTKSTVFDLCTTPDSSNKPNKVHKTSSSEFNPHSTPLPRARSKTFQCSMNSEESERKFLSTKRSSKDFNRSVLVSGTCAVGSKDCRPFVLSCGNNRTGLRIKKDNIQNFETGESPCVGDLWSNDAKPGCISGSKRKSNPTNQSHVFDHDDPSSPAILWSSDFQQAPLISEKSLIFCESSCTRSKERSVN